MLKVKKLDERAIVPTVSNPGEDLGYDLYALENTFISQGTPTKVRTGIAAHYEGHGLLIRDRSSMASKGIVVSGGVVDAGYRGEIVVLLTDRLGAEGYVVKAGDKIAQMIPLPVKTHGDIVVVDELPTSSRGDRGFGSSGR